MYTRIADEVTDKYSNKEITTLCLRFVDCDNIKKLIFVALVQTTGERIDEEILLSLRIMISTPGPMYSEQVSVQSRIRLAASLAVLTPCCSHAAVCGFY